MQIMRGGELIRPVIFTVFGSDARQAALLDILRADGYAAYRQEENPSESPDGCRIAILPMPLLGAHGEVRAGESAEALLAGLSRLDLVIGGRIPADFIKRAEDAGIRIFDYALREDFAVSNAATTAEAALAVAMEHEDRALYTLSALVVGYGRIGKFLARFLRALGAQTAVSARKSADFALLRAEGYPCLDTRALAGLDRFDLIFNTVPFPVLGREALARTKPDCLLIDLASAPGGIDFDAAKALSRGAISALRLPGAYAPRTAAKTSAESIYAILAEEIHEK